MLKRKQVLRHQGYLLKVARASSTKKIRKLVKEATYYQLRTLLVLVASLALKQVPASSQVQRAFATSRKKKTLKKYFSSWAKVRRFLSQRNTENWRDVLYELAPLIGVTARSVVRHS